MMNLFGRFVRETEGQDLIEYALLAALLGIVSYAIIGLVGNAVSTKFGVVNTSLGGGS